MLWEGSDFAEILQSQKAWGGLICRMRGLSKTPGLN